MIQAVLMIGSVALAVLMAFVGPWLFDLLR